MSERERAAGTWINKLKRELNNVRVGYFHPIIGGLRQPKLLILILPIKADTLCKFALRRICNWQNL
jgi:hypothetical protein